MNAHVAPPKLPPYKQTAPVPIGKDAELFCIEESKPLVVFDAPLKRPFGFLFLHKSRVAVVTILALALFGEAARFLATKQDTKECRQFTIGRSAIGSCDYIPK